MSTPDLLARRPANLASSGSRTQENGGQSSALLPAIAETSLVDET